MTTRTERYQSLLNVEWMLMTLINTPGRINKRELKRFVAIMLRHYPTKHDLQMIRKYDESGLL